MSDTPRLPPTFTAPCFGALWQLVAQINEGWQERWGEEQPGFCFRGMDDSNCDLNPGLLRPPFPEDPEELCRLENSLWGEFLLRSKPLLGRQVSGAWEALLIMQQFGFPTRFLDWSRSLAVAAYFAVRDLDNEQDGAVWIMASRYLMEARGLKGVWRAAVGHDCLEPLRPRENADGLPEFIAQLPIAVSPHQLVDRIVAQHGIYTLHTFERNALERLGLRDRAEHDGACFLHKVIVPGSAKAEFRSEILVLAGVSEETLFPDLEGFARAFVADHKERARRRSGGRPPGR